MRSMKIYIALTFLLIGACSAEKNTIVNAEYPLEVKEDLVRAGCQKVLEAIEAFAAENGGEYPVDLASDTTLAGNRFIDFLPEGRRLTNPFTGEETEPTLGTAASPGQIGYQLPHPLYPPRQYRITGFGADSMIVELSNTEELEEKVRENCRTLQTAVERFAALNGGIYPGDAGADCTPGGETVIDLLPEGRLMINPCTGCETEPISASAANPGETGLIPICMCGINTGYVITGVGVTAGNTILILSFHYVPEGCGTAVESK